MALVKGTKKANKLKGTKGNDSIYGYEGNDVLDGGLGNDNIDGGNGKDTLYGNLGNDTLYGGTGYDKLYGGDGYDVIYTGASAGIDKDGGYAEGGNGDDTLYGSRGKDILKGDTGNDRIYLSEGTDVLYGGKGADRFVIKVNPQANFNTKIMDFEKGKDKIDVRDVVWEVYTDPNLSGYNFSYDEIADLTIQTLSGMTDKIKNGSVFSGKELGGGKITVIMGNGNHLTASDFTY